ncbi:hypothetical protein ABZU86_19315 [Streptomyces sp. NPDC005271]|uniref:hypothetical protein n=1 Tax=unclassified Streptomyces TaxID=2593676 RepID=UPI0033B8D0DF
MRVPGRIRCPHSRGHTIVFLTAAACYAAVLVAVLTGSELVRLDWHVGMLKPYKQWPQAQTAFDVFGIAGQRGPTAVAALAWLSWRGRRTRDPRPPLALGIALPVLNGSVGAVKILTGRLGPHAAQTPGSAELFRGGDVLPSGHTANAVVIRGALAHLAGRHRRGGRRDHLRDGLRHRSDHRPSGHPLGQRCAGRVGGGAPRPAGPSPRRTADRDRLF